MGVNAHQDRVVAVEDFVMQSNPNLGEVLGLLDVCGALSSGLMQVVYATHADGDDQNVAHEFHHATVGAVANECEGKSDLVQPRFGHREVEQDIIITSRWGECLFQRELSLCLLLVDKLAADHILSGEVADVGSTGQRLNGQLDALGRKELGRRKSR